MLAAGLLINLGCSTVGWVSACRTCGSDMQLEWRNQRKCALRPCARPRQASYAARSRTCHDVVRHRVVCNVGQQPGRFGSLASPSYVRHRSTAGSAYEDAPRRLSSTQGSAESARCASQSKVSSGRKVLCARETETAKEGLRKREDFIDRGSRHVQQTPRHIQSRPFPLEQPCALPNGYWRALSMRCPKVIHMPNTRTLRMSSMSA